ncbi:MAG: hypothetical protein ACKO37_07760 [Vampirovibrionales bacterium]
MLLGAVGCAGLLLSTHHAHITYAEALPKRYNACDIGILSQLPSSFGMTTLGPLLGTAPRRIPQGCSGFSKTPAEIHKRIQKLIQEVAINPWGDTTTAKLYNLATMAYAYGDGLAAVVLMHHVLLRSATPTPPLVYIDFFIQSYQANQSVDLLIQQLDGLLALYPQHPWLPLLHQRALSSGKQVFPPKPHCEGVPHGSECHPTDPELMHY